MSDREKRVVAGVFLILSAGTLDFFLDNPVSSAVFIGVLVGVMTDVPESERPISRRLRIGAIAFLVGLAWFTLRSALSS